MFEKFKKNKKKSVVILVSILGMMLIVGVITLFKTYAFYKDKREFNVLRGRIPEFSHEDIQLTFVINGTKGENFPTKKDGLVATNVTCENGVTADWDNVNWSLIHIESNNNKQINCNIDFITSENINLFDNVNIGDYISYTPILENYDITNSLTGINTYTESGTYLTTIKNVGKQSINPSELNLWRVIRKNSDGTIDLVSEYLSSKNIHFFGKEGYKKYVGTLNTIASAYETNGVTSGSRYIGYDGQTENITDETKLNQITAPWTEYATSENSPKGSERERLGGGDVLHETDVNLVKTAVGNLVAFIVNETSTAKGYLVTNRGFYYKSNSEWHFSARYVSKEGNIYGSYLYSYNSGFSGLSYSGFLRPIVTLKSGIQASSGNGSQINPWKVN